MAYKMKGRAQRGVRKKFFPAIGPSPSGRADNGEKIGRGERKEWEKGMGETHGRHKTYVECVAVGFCLWKIDHSPNISIGPI